MTNPTDETHSDNHGECEIVRLQRLELDRRIADMEENPDDVFTWEEAKAQLSKRP
ncbi:MAG: hypothetical protein JNL96_28200 [Planctomycetaceae bacterium]|nr:hypothetical protein [Planctomycetaceae bacterium]